VARNKVQIKGKDKLRGLNKGETITLPSLNIRPINAVSYQLVEIIKFSISSAD